MIKDINLINIMQIYEKEISKNVKNKRKLRNFENNKMQNISNILNMLHNGNIGHTKYNIFLIYEPKARLVMSLDVKDKIINHFLTRFILEKKLTKYLDYRNVATRKDMGTDYAIKLLLKFLNKNKKYKKLYALKIDIRKYFYNINHDILKSQLMDKLDPLEYSLIEKVIDSTNYEYINKEIEKLTRNRNVNIPFYETGKGLPIGNMTSQFLSIFYLSGLDHYIIHDLKLKYYIRYMDDFIILSHDKEKLKDARQKIKDKLNNEYDLKLNDKKTRIYDLKEGFSFLGYVFKFNDNKKTIIKIKKCNYEKIKKRVKQVRYDVLNDRMTFKKAFCSIMTYSHCYKFSDNKKLLKIIGKYFYHEYK